jgi:hypothetical protein
MAIRSTEGRLGIREILSDTNAPIFEPADLIGLGIVVGATSGLGDGNSVILSGRNSNPTCEFLGQDFNLTATAGSFNLSSVTFANTGGNQNVNISTSGVWRLSNIPSFVSVDQVYGNGSATVNISAADNSALGSANNSSVSIQLLGSSNSVLDTLPVSQPGNPITFQFSVTSVSANYAAGNTDVTFSATPGFTMTFNSSNTNIMTPSVVSSNTSSDPNTYTVRLSRNLRYNTSSAGANLSATGSFTQGQTVITSILFTQEAYDTIRWGNLSEISSIEFNSVGGTQTIQFGGATSIPYNSTQTPPGGHPWTITASGGPYSWISSVSASSGNYHPGGDSKVGGGASDIGIDDTTFTFTTNNTSATRTASYVLEDTTSGITKTLSISQPVQELSTFDIDSGETDPHILTLPTKSFPVGTYTLQVTANSGFDDDWEIQGTVAGSNSYTSTAFYDTSKYEHKKSTDSSWSPITTALTGTGNATIQVQNSDTLNGRAWSSYQYNMVYPYYRFRSSSYPSNYSETVTIKQTKALLDFQIKWESTNNPSSQTYALNAGQDEVLQVWAKDNGVGVKCGASALSNATSEVKLLTASSTSYVDLRNNTTVFGGSPSDWTNTTLGQPASGYDYLLELQIKNTVSAPGTAPSSTQYTSITVRQNYNNMNSDSVTYYQYMGGSSGGGGGNNPAILCLLYEMKVLTSDNKFINVNDVIVGDLLETNLGLSKVTKVITEHKREGYYIIEEGLKITNDHPIKVNNEWVRADEYIGDKKYIKEEVDTVYIETENGEFNTYSSDETKHWIVSGDYAKKIF